MTDATRLGLFGLPLDDAPAGADADLVLDVFGEPADPSAAFACPKARRKAFEQWVAGGRDFDRLPVGLLGAICGAALGSRKQ
ncbi:hypothetical protein [Neoroseomonas soli]|uniref:Uncharacterized protein n=1 Tax=Neoroseomonas soli TaxID=1081025 RepID=A0A9X9WVH9_9PROT|nr:hypothetical protein [Neoroseomonas soli]MBR0671158.1 hypothetical protein [Neoroseomonas soli]